MDVEREVKILLKEWGAIGRADHVTAVEILARADEVLGGLKPEVKVALQKIVYQPGCSWIVAVPTSSLYPAEAEWYPDSPSDVYTEVECGQPSQPGARHGLCEFHQYALDLPDDEFEAISEAHDGRAFS